MKKRMISMLLAILLVFSALSCVCFAGDAQYWPAQSAYAKARSSGNEAAILSAVKAIEKAYPKPANATQYERVAFPVYEAAKIYEARTEYDAALTYYQKFLSYITWLQMNTKANYKDHLLNIPKVIQHLSVQPEVYAATTQTVSYTNGKYEPRRGTLFGACGAYNDTEQSAILRYVTFSVKDKQGENFEDYQSTFNAAGENFYIELAWNVPHETIADLNAINNGSRDAYIQKNLSYLKGVKAKVLLRFCAEVNNWNQDSSGSVAFAFKKAYVRIAKMARNLCPNVALVFSPNDIDNRNVNFRDFYPGDQYVDWVGMSSYLNISGAATNGVSGNDAFYCRGLYENQMVKIKDIIDTYGSRKPIMISECGFAYKSSDGRQNITHAVKKLKEFYSYVNMVYPQVKAVFYFNKDMEMSYSLSGNSTLKAAYDQTIAANEPMNQNVSYTKVDNLKYKADRMNFSTYIYYPSAKETTVKYLVDGKSYGTKKAAPYTISVDTGAWSVGTHTISVTTKCGVTTRTVIKVLKKAADGKITCSGSLRDVKTSHWAFSNIDYCLQNNIFSGVSFTTFETETVMTRAMFVQVLANISGVNLKNYKKDIFKDVKKTAWYGPAVAWAYEKKIVDGVDKTHFAPEDKVTREQMCAMLYRYAGATGTKLPNKYKADVFADQAKIGGWARKSVAACQRAGIINGEKSGSKVYFNPQNGATRAQAAKVFHTFELAKSR